MEEEEEQSTNLKIGPYAWARTKDTSGPCFVSKWEVGGERDCWRPWHLSYSPIMVVHQELNKDTNVKRYS